jgi:hypothetical protein
VRWTFGPTIQGKLYSYDEHGRPIQSKKTKDGLEFSIPPSPGEIDYLTTKGKDLGKAKLLRCVYDLKGDGKLKAVGQDGADVSARIRLHVQRKGDNWTGNGPYEHYRFWSSVSSELLPGKERVLECALDPALWTGVYGKTNAGGFDAVLKNCIRMGITFGGMFAGHGVRSRGGEVVFVLRKFEVG